MEGLAPALFLDRDGVIHKEVGYLCRPEQVEFVPGIFELCRTAQAKRYRLIVVTNQSGIARGLYSEADFHALMNWMVKRFEREQIKIDGYYFCPHHPLHGIGEYRKECPARKPGPGMMLDAANEHRINLRRSIVVGDRCSDMQAGAAAGIDELFLLEGTEKLPCPLAVQYRCVSSLSEVASFIRWIEEKKS